MALEEALPRYHAEGRRPVLIVDEAHQLSPALLEEIRLLLNLENSKEKFLDIVLAGQPELIHVLGRPELRQLKQRVSCYCRVGPLTLQETKEYIHHRLSYAGLREQHLFPEDSLATIYRCTGGIPRLVNSLCDSSLQTGFALQAKTITGEIVREAAKDLDLFMDDAVHTLSNGASAVPPKMRSVPVAFAPAVSISLPSGPTMSAPLASAAAASSGSIPSTAAERHEPVNTKDEAAQSATVLAVPLESYASRQKSLGFLASLVARWT